MGYNKGHIYIKKIFLSFNLFGIAELSGNNMRGIIFLSSAFHYAASWITYVLDDPAVLLAAL